MKETSSTSKREAQIHDLANTIAQQAEAIATGNHTAPATAVARLLRENAMTLLTWTVIAEADASEAVAR
jgi:hypothetical protein